VTTDVLREVGRLLEGAHVPYVVIGGHAVNAWIEPRFTADVDVTVRADAADFEQLKQVFVPAGYTVAREHGVDLPSGPDFVRFVSADGVVIVELQAAKTEFQREVVRRGTPTEEGLRVATVEDLIVLKLIANRAKDRIDLGGLLRLPAVDWNYVERWALEWGVVDELHRLRRACSPTAPST